MDLLNPLGFMPYSEGAQLNCYTTLSRKQDQAIAALLTCPSILDAAVKAVELEDLEDRIAALEDDLHREPA